MAQGIRSRASNLFGIRAAPKNARDRLLDTAIDLFYAHGFHAIGLDLMPGVNDKHTAPEDIARTSIPHTMHILRREAAPTKLAALRTRLHDRVQTHIRKIQKRKAD